MTVFCLLELTGTLQTKQGVVPRQMNQETAWRRFDTLLATSTCGRALFVFFKDLKRVCGSNVEERILRMRNSKIGHK